MKYLELIKEIVSYSKANGVKINQEQVKMTLTALREISKQSLQEGDYVNLDKFLKLELKTQKGRKLKMPVGNEKGVIYDIPNKEVPKARLLDSFKNEIERPID